MATTDIYSTLNFKTNNPKDIEGYNKVKNTLIAEGWNIGILIQERIEELGRTYYKDKELPPTTNLTKAGLEGEYVRIMMVRTFEV